MSSLLIRHSSGGQAQCLPEHHYTASSVEKGQGSNGLVQAGHMFADSFFAPLPQGDLPLKCVSSRETGASL